MTSDPVTVPLVSIIIPVFNKWEYTAKCLSAIDQNTRDVSYEVIILDNASGDETAQALSRLGNVRFRRNAENLGFAKASNQGADMARGKYLMFLNNDTEPRAGWLSALVRMMESDPQIAMVGSKLLYPDGTIQHGGVAFSYAAPLPIGPFHLHVRLPAEASTESLSLRAVTGACMLLRPEVYRAVGGFDEGYINGYEDVDLCLKVWKTGAKIVYTPNSVVVHHESKTDGRFARENFNIDRLNRRWTREFTAFDLDPRHDIPTAVIDPGRPGTSVIIPMYDALWSLAPCLENVRYTTGPQDEIIVVDDGSPGAISEFAAHFAASHPKRVRLIRNLIPVGLPAAALQGLEVATKPRVAVMVPSLRVVGDWLGRLSRHLETIPRLGAVTPTLLPVGHLPLNELVYPVSSTATNAPPPGPATVESIRIPTALLFYAERERLLALGRATPGLLFGDDQEALAGALQRQGMLLGRAADVGVLKLTQIPGDSDADLTARYTAQESANLTYEASYHSLGRPPIGTVTAAQTELTSLVIVANDIPDITLACLESIYAHTHRPLEIVLVDNGSSASLRVLAATMRARHGNLSYIRAPPSEGYAQACNQGLAAARGEYIGILHNDVVVTPGWLGRLLAAMAMDPSVALAGPALSQSANVQAVNMRTYNKIDDLIAFSQDWAVNHRGEIAVFKPLSGVCLVLRRQVLDRIGGLDPAFHTGIHADDDFCLRAFRADFRMAIVFSAFVHHHGSATFKALGLDRKLATVAAARIFAAKWGIPRDGDGKIEVAIQELAAQPFDPARDRIPLYHDDGPPLIAAA
jgi:GT2 family glycosyltransferase